MRHVLVETQFVRTVVERAQAFVIDHLHIIQPNGIQHIDAVRAGRGVRRTATRLLVGGEGREDIRRLVIRRRIGERHSDALPVHVCRAVVDGRRTDLRCRVVTRLRILVAGIGRDDGAHARFVELVCRIAVGRQVLGPEHQRVRSAVERRVETGVGRIGEVIVALRIIRCHRGRMDLSVGAVSVRLDTEDDVRTDHRALRAVRTRAHVVRINELMHVRRHEIRHLTGSRTERVPAGRLVIGPVAFEPAVVHRVVVMTHRIPLESDEDRLRQRRGFDIEHHLCLVVRQHRVMGLGSFPVAVDERDSRPFADGVQVERAVLQHQLTVHTHRYVRQHDVTQFTAVEREVRQHEGDGAVHRTRKYEHRLVGIRRTAYVEFTVVAS